jgi:hypothetical protein
MALLVLLVIVLPLLVLAYDEAIASAAQADRPPALLEPRR